MAVPLRSRSESVPSAGEIKERPAPQEVAAEDLRVLVVEEVGDVDARVPAPAERRVEGEVDDGGGRHVAGEDAGPPGEAVHPAAAEAGAEAFVAVRDPQARLVLRRVRGERACARRPLDRKPEPRVAHVEPEGIDLRV